MPSEISIRDLTNTKGFEASLITTFNGNLQFYEEVVLRRLRANGCRHNVVLMDSAQCAIAWATEATRPRYAGHDYSLVPIRATGAFHPKISIFAGPKKLALLVGSHNLTLSGFGYNREITNLIESTGTKQDNGRILDDVWQSVSAWVCSADCPKDLQQSALAFERYIKPFLNAGSSQDGPLFLAQSERKSALFDQLRAKVGFQVRRGVVMGAFFDEQLAFLKALRSTWPAAEFVIGIDPDSVYLPRTPSDEKIRFVDARSAWPGDSNKYLHAKALYLDDLEGEAVFLSGSANPSGPGWGTSPFANTEAMILLRGSAAREALETTKLGRFITLETISAIMIASAVERAGRIQPALTSMSLQILVGVADDEAKTISLTVRDSLMAVRVIALDEDDQDLGIEAEVVAEEASLTVTFSEGVPEVRSLLLYQGEHCFARVLVHHSAVVNASSASTRQHLIRVALGELGGSGTDVAWLIEQVQHVIFSGDVANHTAGARGGRRGAEVDQNVDRPDSLALDIGEIAKRKQKRRLIDSGDLGYLIDILIHQLHTPRASSATHIAEPGPAGSEDEEDPSGQNDPEVEMDDAEIAAAVYRKSRSLIRKMIAREQAVAADKTQAPAMLGQLLAVLAILKELRHLERQGRWKDQELEMVDSNALYSLMKESMLYLFSSAHSLWRFVENDSTEVFEELDNLNILLTWLAWEVGYSFNPRIPAAWEIEAGDREFLLAGNGYLAKLLPRVAASDHGKTLEMTLHRTIRTTPKEKRNADAWIQLNGICGEALLEEFTARASQSGVPFLVGGFAYVPKLIEPWTVVLDVDEKFVRLWDFEEDRSGHLIRRSFLHSVAMPSGAIGN